MNFSLIAIAVLSLVFANNAHAATDKKRVKIEARWYTQAYIKQHLAQNDPRRLASAYSSTVSYIFAADASGVPSAGENLLKKDVKSVKSDFVRWPSSRDARPLKTQLDDMCVRLIAGRLRGLGQGVRQRSQKTTPKNIVVAEIYAGELTAAPLSLERTTGPDAIRVIPPKGEGRMLCNIYKTTRGGDIMYDVSVVLVAKAAYPRSR